MPMAMQPCIWTDMLEEYPPEDAIRIIGEAGFRYVEFGLGHERDYLEGKEDEGARLARIRRAAEEAGVQIVQMHGRLFDLCRPGCEDDIAWAHRSIRRAGQLGVRWVVLHPGSDKAVGADPKALEWTRQRNVDVFRAFLKTAEEANTGIAIENMIGGRVGGRFGVTTSDLLWLVEQLNSDRVGICWDTGHGNLSRIDQGQAIRAIGRRLVALHIDDNDGAKDRHWTPLRGEVNWVDVMAALHDVGYSGPFNFELPGEAAVTPTAAKPEKIRYLLKLAQVLIDPAFVAEKEAEQAQAAG